MLAPLFIGRCSVLRPVESVISCRWDGPSMGIAMLPQPDHGMSFGARNCDVRGIISPSVRVVVGRSGFVAIGALLSEEDTRQSKGG